MTDRRSARNKEVPDYKAMNEGKGFTPKRQLIEPVLAFPSQLFDLNEEDSTVTPPEVLPESRPSSDLAEKKEKERLLRRLSELDEHQARLQERRELEILRKKVEEKEAFVSELEKSLHPQASDLSSRKKGSHTRPTTSSSRGQKSSKSSLAGAEDHSILLKKSEKECDAALALRYAEHLLMPLVDEKKYVIDTYPGLQSVKCCDVEHPLSGKFGDTSFGLQDGWHGKVDVLISDAEDRLPVFIAESTDDDVSMSDIEERSCEKSSGDAYAQMIAKTFVFSFLQHKQNSGKLRNSLIPSIGIIGEKFIVFMYDCEKDVLLGSCVLSLFYEGSIDVRSVVFLWLVLNYRLFCSGLIDDFKSFKSEFHTLVGDEYLERYRNEVTMPCHEKSSRKRAYDPSISENPPAVRKRVNRAQYPVILALKLYGEDCR